MTQSLSASLEKLGQNFNIVVCKNLCEFFNGPSGDLFFFLKDLKKEQFEDKERLVFYLNEKINQDALTAIYRRFLLCLEVTDIPKFFVVVLADANSAETMVSLDKEITVIEVEETPVERFYNSAHFIEPKLLCGYPWISLHVNQDGTAGPCDRYAHAICQENGLPYNINEHDPETIFKSQYLVTLRQKFRDGVRLKNCRKCWKVEDSVSGISTRQNFKRSHPEYPGISWETDGELLEVTQD